MNALRITFTELGEQTGVDAVGQDFQGVYDTGAGTIEVCISVYYINVFF